MEEDKLNKAIDLLKSEIEIYDQYYCLATSQALKIVLNELKESKNKLSLISEVCVDESKLHIESSNAIEEIRKILKKG